MRVPAKYPSCFTSNEATVLTSEAQHATRNLGLALKTETVSPELIESFRAATHALPANAVPQATDDIRRIAGMDWLFLDSANGMGLADRPPRTEAQNTPPGLGWLTVFHADGRHREAALRALNDPPQSAFEFTAICYRLNDWVPQIRDAAETYADRFFPITQPRAIAEAAMFLLEMEHDLGRWTAQGRGLLLQCFRRADVAQAMATALMRAQSGGFGYVLQQLLRQPELDSNLPELAQNAALPGVRRVASETLLRGSARFFEGWEQQWIDKSLGKSRRSPRYGTRVLTIHTDFELTLSHAGNDRSAKVREVAADALIARRNQATSHMDEIAETLAQDNRPSVRSRAAFYLRKRKGDT